VVSRGERVLFVCTKKQLRPVIQSEAERSNSFHVTERWLGGMLTNFSTIKKQIRRLRELERGQEEGAFDFYTKKERLMLDREREKLDKYLSGVKDMARIPGAIFVVDAKKERIAVNEANKLGIPVIAIADTNADPDLLTVPIAGNDDAIRSVSVISQRDRRRDHRGARRDAGRRAPPRRRGRGDDLLSETGESAPADDDRRAEAPPAPQAPPEAGGDREPPRCREDEGRKRPPRPRRRAKVLDGATGKPSWPHSYPGPPWVAGGRRAKIPPDTPVSEPIPRKNGRTPE
jgi:small subunit ribosomal protein S2